MLIHLNKSKIFTVHPARRFAKEYCVPQTLWTEIWKRYILNAYDVSELCEYYLIKSKKEINGESMRRWIFMTYVYSKANDALKKGTAVVRSEFFGDQETLVLKELTKNIRFSKAISTKNIV